MGERLEWTSKLRRRQAAQQAWQLALPSFRRSILLSAAVAAFTLLTVSAIAPELQLPVLEYAAVALGVPCLLLLAPLLALLSPNTRYRVSPSGMAINGRAFRWRHVIELAHSSQAQVLLVAHRAGAVHEVRLPEAPIREQILLAIRQWSGSELRSSASVAAPQFSGTGVWLLVSMAAINALVVSASFSLVRPHLQPSTVGPFLLAASLPSAMVGALLARFQHPRFTRLLLPLGYIALLMSSGMSVIFVLAFLVRSHAST